MKVPVPGRNAPLLPIEPARVLFDRGPHNLRRKREAGSQSVHGAGDVHADQNAANIEDDGAELGRRHSLFALRPGSGAGAAILDGTELMPGAIDADDCGKHGNHDNNGDDVMNALTNIRDRAAQRVAAENHGADPKNPSANVEGNVAGVGHLCGAGDGRAEGSNDGNEARENNGPAAIFFIKIVGALKMASAEEERVFAAVQSCTRRAANPVANLIAHDGAKHDGQEKPLQGDDAGSGENSGGHQQGITGKKKSNKKTGFDEDDEADEGGAAGAD